MGFFQRLANLWTGFLSLWISDAEARNPEAVYEAAINERIRKHKELKKAVSGIVYLRNKLQAELEDKEKQFRQVSADIPVAIEEGEDEVALVLIQKKDELTSSIEDLSSELEKVEAQAEDAKAGLMEFQSEIDKLRREKDSAIAAASNAKARIEIQDALSGLSTEADIQALNGVRTHIEKLKAEADVGAELGDSSLDAKLKKIRSRTGDVNARAQLDEMKRQMAARKAAAEGAAVKKTM